MKTKKRSNLKQRVAVLEEQLKRALADYHNLVTRLETEKKDRYFEILASIVDKLLPLYEDLRRAQQHLKDKGLGLIINQFWRILTSEGVEEIKADGEQFNPQLMDCVAVVKSGKQNKNRVVEVVQPGYTLKGRVIRPAKVKVGG